MVARDVLTKHGLRATPQRVEVLEELMREHGDLTAQALHGRLRAGGAALGLATVYRTLGVLAERGVIDTLAHGASQCYRFCASEHHHHHLTCRSCHAIVEVEQCAVGEWAGAVGAEHGFVGVEHRIELIGTCRRCARAQ